MNREYVVGDIFKIRDNALQMDKFVVLTRALMDAEHFFLVSLGSFEPWSERTLTFTNRYEKTKLEESEIQYLANTSRVKYLGNMNEYRNKIVEILDMKEAV